jgi:hypothetical protein
MIAHRLAAKLTDLLRMYEKDLLRMYEKKPLPVKPEAFSFLNQKLPTQATSRKTINI